ncbi:MAG TPA: hypothetical protein VM287_00815 [Egibacteraceae bacterium]|nr:hypothetical protein [Egibacteraceae bacterium]
MDKETARKALLGINLVVGIMFLLFPKLSMRLYGLDPEKDVGAAYPVRYVGGRSLTFAAMLSDDQGTDVLTKQLPVIAGVDATANALAAMTGEVPKRVVVLGALTSGLATAFGLASRP